MCSPHRPTSRATPCAVGSGGAASPSAQRVALPPSFLSVVVSSLLSFLNAPLHPPLSCSFLLLSPVLFPSRRFPSLSSAAQKCPFLSLLVDHSSLPAAGRRRALCLQRPAPSIVPALFTSGRAVSAAALLIVRGSTRCLCLVSAHVLPMSPSESCRGFLRHILQYDRHTNTNTHTHTHCHQPSPSPFLVAALLLSERARLGGRCAFAAAGSDCRPSDQVASQATPRPLLAKHDLHHPHQAGQRALILSFCATVCCSRRRVKVQTSSPSSIPPWLIHSQRKYWAPPAAAEASGACGKSIE